MHGDKDFLMIMLTAAVLWSAPEIGGSKLPASCAAGQPELSPENPLGFDINVMCGPCCLWQIARVYGKACSLDAIRSKAQTDPREGTTMRGMIEAAHEIGLEAAGVKMNIRTLTQDPRTAVLLLNVGGNGHYVILDRIANDRVRLLDGPKFRDLSVDQLKSLWDGYAILIGRRGTSDAGRLRMRLGVTLQGIAWLLMAMLCLFGLRHLWSHALRRRPLDHPRAPSRMSYPR
jgi:hypothetical protein